MEYPKAVMTIKELTTLGFSDEWLRMIYRSRAINKTHAIAWKLSEKPKSTIQFDTEALEKYRRSCCTGI